MTAVTLERPTKPLEKLKQNELQTLAKAINGLCHKGLRKIEFTEQTPSKALRIKIKGALRELDRLSSNGSA